MIEKKISYREEEEKPKPQNVIPFPHKPGTPMYEWWKAELSPNPEDYPEMESLTIEDIIKEGIPISPMAKKKKKKREGIESLDVFSKLASVKRRL